MCRDYSSNLQSNDQDDQPYCDFKAGGTSKVSGITSESLANSEKKSDTIYIEKS